MLVNYGLALALESIMENVTAQFSLHPPAAAWPCLPAALHTDPTCKSSQFVLFLISQCSFSHESTSLQPSRELEDVESWQMQRQRGGQATELSAAQKRKVSKKKLKSVLTKGLFDYSG